MRTCERYEIPFLVWFRFEKKSTKTTSSQGAERTLKEAVGVNMHTWFVGNVPIGHRAYNYPWGIIDEGKNGGKKVFFMKARILAGQADLADNKLGLDDFKWVTKEEIQPLVSGKYWRALKGALSDR
jgi:large subunit ribosomal protein L46